MGQDMRERPAQQPLKRRAAVRGLDVRARVIEGGQVVMQARQPRQRSMWRTVAGSAGPPDSSICLIR